VTEEMDISEGGEAMTKRHTNKQQQSQSASSGGRNLIPAACGNYSATHFLFYFLLSLSDNASLPSFFFFSFSLQIKIA